MPTDANENTSPAPGASNGRWRGGVESDLKTILRLSEKFTENQGKLADELSILAQRVSVVETKATTVDATMPNLALKEDVAKDIRNHASHETRNNVLSGGGGTVGGIAIWEAIRALIM